MKSRQARNIRDYSVRYQGLAMYFGYEEAMKRFIPDQRVPFGDSFIAMLKLAALGLDINDLRPLGTSQIRLQV